MHLERHSEQKDNPIIPDQIEASPSSEKDLQKLENWLASFIGEEATGQCVFVLRLMADKNYRNQCKDAVKAFGRGLAENFGEEESFFELAPHAKFSEARLNYSPPKMSYHVDFHDVGLLEFRMPKRKPFSLIFDLNYGAVAGESDKDRILVIYSPGTEKQSFETLRNRYGGLWKKEFEFDRRTGNFVYRYH